MLTFSMDLIDVYLFSPASIFVAVVAITFLLYQAWPHLSRQKEPDEPRLTPPPKDDSHDSQHPTVTKEPEIPEGFWTCRETFDLERRALFSKVQSPNSVPPEQSLTIHTSPVMALPRTRSPICQTRHVPVLRRGRLPHLPDQRQRRQNPRLPQCLSTPCVYRHPQGIRCVDRARVQVSRLEL